MNGKGVVDDCESAGNGRQSAFMTNRKRIEEEQRGEAAHWLKARHLKRATTPVFVMNRRMRNRTSGVSGRGSAAPPAGSFSRSSVPAADTVGQQVRRFTDPLNRNYHDVQTVF